MTVDFELAERLPTVGEHRRLFAEQGWHWYGEATVERSLAGSLHGVVAVRAGEVVGMGRVIGDGGAFHYVQDLVVLPDERGAGIGSALLARLLALIGEASPSTTVVGLFSTPEAIPLYRRFGFGEPELTGLMTVLPNERTREV